HLFSEPHWEQAVRRRDPDLLLAEARRISAAVEKSLGQPPRGDVSVAGLRRLVSDWGLAWLGTVGQVPRKGGIRWRPSSKPWGAPRARPATPSAPPWTTRRARPASC